MAETPEDAVAEEPVVIAVPPGSLGAGTPQPPTETDSSPPQE